MMPGKTLKIFVMGEDPSSFKKVELSNWTGQAFIGERRHIGEVKKRPELKNSSIYFLFTENLESGFTDIYIGESDDFITRILQHENSKDWWSKFVVFISQNLTKAHVKYLEKKLYFLAKDSIGTLRLRNETEPSGAKLPESDIADMEIFLENMIFTLGALGLGYFSIQSDIASIIPKYKTDEKIEEYECNLQPEFKGKKGELLKATLQSIGDRYILKAGSFLRNGIQPSFRNHPYYTLFSQVIKSKNVKKSNTPWSFNFNERYRVQISIRCWSSGKRKIN